MEVIFLKKALEDLEYFKKINNSGINKKIQQLLKSIQESPYSGIGKPEALKHKLTGIWSRRINQEHRMIYGISEKENAIVIYSLKGHY